MEILLLIGLLWAWDSNLWEKVDPEPFVEEIVVSEAAVDVTQVTATATALIAVGEALNGTTTVTSTSTTSSTGTSTSTSTSTGT